MTKSKYIVAQVGARRGYAVPAILADAGMLARFHTDICGNVGLGRFFSMGAPVSTGLARLANRRVPAPVLPLTRTYPVRSALHFSRKWFGDANLADLRWQSALGRAAVREEFAGATHVFSMFGEFPALLIAAKERGLGIVSEVYINLAADRILAEERKSFRGWEPEMDTFADGRSEFPRADIMLSLSDLFVCPSEAVRDDLIVSRGIKEGATVIVPYGVNPEWLELCPEPTRGRVLFAGSAQLRKGIHYLAMAAAKLASRGKDFDFRVAGGVSTAVASQPECQRLTFLGRVPRAHIQKEFLAADVFVLPSLAEGSAEVVYEALAVGLPVITTKSAGSIVRDGIEGRIVPERDPAAIALAIEEIVDDRERRARMSTAARERAIDYTWKRYGERLLSALVRPVSL